MQVDARGVPLLGDGAVHVAIHPESCAPNGQAPVYDLLTEKADRRFGSVWLAERRSP